MIPIPFEKLPKLPKLKLAVVGHMEWVSFLKVDKLPQAGEISHAKIYREEPAGGGAVVAVKLAELTKTQVVFYTALGNDALGEKSVRRLNELGVNVNVAWKNEGTRKAISLLDPMGDRAITVIGNRIEPEGKDLLPWNDLNDFDGIFITATDNEGLNHCKKVNVTVATPRLGLKRIEESKIELSALIGSGLDPDENFSNKKIVPLPKLMISTEGALGGYSSPGGHFPALKLNSPIIDSYGCGDSFAAGVTAGLSAGWGWEQVISLGCHCGATAACQLGPYNSSI